MPIVRRRTWATWEKNRLAELLLIVRLLAIIALYGLLGGALFILWRDLKVHSELLSKRQAPTIHLLSESPDAQGEKIEHAYQKPEVILGRGPSADCQLEDSAVSTRHARLAYHHQQWWLEDLGSTNGTFLNEEPVSTPFVVTTGDILRCGKIVLTIQLE